jgi:hypothetical protein
MSLINANINGFESKDPSVRFSATMTNIFLTLKRFVKPIRFLPQVKMGEDTFRIVSVRTKSSVLHFGQALFHLTASFDHQHKHRLFN